MADSIGDELKKLVLIGIGAAAATAEKSKEIVDVLVKKGELTVEQGKVLNEELKHKIKEAFSEKVNVNVFKEKSTETFINELDKLTPEEIAALKAKLEQMDKNASESGNAESR
ncbi:MAG: hypothetical protein ACYCYI_06470 [Saccharofermentanales bacterium]